MRRFLEKLANNLWADAYEPKDSIQIIMKKNGEPVGGIYKDDDQEVRSPTMKTQDNR